jgi:hypothetical protein
LQRQFFGNRFERRQIGGVNQNIFAATQQIRSAKMAASHRNALVLDPGLKARAAELREALVQERVKTLARVASVSR